MNNSFSETIGSFIRTGNYPIEGDYIFENESELRAWASDPLIYPTLHEGLLKIVKSLDGLELWWVVTLLDLLTFKRLIKSSDVDTTFDNLNDLYELLNQEIQSRKNADIELWGTNDKYEIDDDFRSILKLADALKYLINLREETRSDLKAAVGTEEEDIVAYLLTLEYKSITELSQTLHRFLNASVEGDSMIWTLASLQEFLTGYDESNHLCDLLEDLYNRILGSPFPTEDFRTLRGIEDFIRIFKTETDSLKHNLLTELDLTLIGIGLSGDGSYNADSETYYLKEATSVMNALKILDSLINQAINNCNLKVSNSNTVELTLVKLLDSTTLSANVLVSTTEGNGIIRKADGLFHKISSTYENGILTVYVNDTIVSQHNIGLAFVGINLAYYDGTTEEIVLVFNKENGTTDVLRIPVSNLIREWIVDNTGTSDVILLKKEEVYGGGPDKLSADVRIYEDKHNILTKVGNSLYVAGTSDNITHNDVKVSLVLDLLTETTNTLTTLTSSIQNDLSTLTNKTQELSEKIDNLELTTVLLLELDNTLQDAITAELTRAELKELDLSNKLDNEISRATNLENLLSEKITSIQSLSDNISEKLEAEISRASLADNELNILISEETSRALLKESELTTLINGKVSLVSLVKIDDLNYGLYVDGELLGTIQIPKDRHLEDVVLIDSVLKFSIVTSEGILVKELDLGSITNTAISELNTLLSLKADKTELVTEVTRATTAELQLTSDLLSEITRATTKELLLETSINSKIGTVKLVQVNELEYELYVDSLLEGVIYIPKDLYLYRIETTDDGLRFIMNTKDGIVPIEISLETIIQDRLLGIKTDLSNLIPRVETLETTVNSLKILKRTGTSDDILEEYYLDNNGSALGETIKIYKDSTVLDIYLGHIDDRINSETGLIYHGTGDPAIVLICTKAGKWELRTMNVSPIIVTAGLGLQKEGTSIKIVPDDSEDTTKYLVVGSETIGLNNITRDFDLLNNWYEGD